MELRKLILNIHYKEIIGSLNTEVLHISQDSRDIKKGSLYVAIQGTQVDGHKYIPEVIQKGASVIVCEKIPDSVNKSTCYVVVKNSTIALGEIASNFYGDPSSELKIIAITGTNGKTTISHLLYQSFLSLGEKAAVFSTAGDFVNGEQIFLNRKAPSSMEIIELQKNLRKMIDEYQCKFVCIEATSHALDQNRLSGVNITGAIFTNLTQDHLNYHGTIEHYASSKKKLFDNLPSSSFCLTNSNDVFGEFMVEDTHAQVFRYGTKNNEVDYFYMLEKMNLEGSHFSINNKSYTSDLLGEFNIANIVAVYGTLDQLGFSTEKIASIVPTLKGAEGRMEIISSKSRDRIVIIDYAHSPDSLAQVLDTLCKIQHNRIITILGVGGGRDRGKRPLMGNISVEKSDYTFFTNDNPRDDDPQEIFNDLTKEISDNTTWEIIPDREEAIKIAVNTLLPGDILLIAGKGHEDYQEIKGVKYPFKDKKVAMKYLTQ